MSEDKEGRYSFRNIMCQLEHFFPPETVTLNVEPVLRNQLIYRPCKLNMTLRVVALSKGIG